MSSVGSGQKSLLQSVSHSVSLSLIISLTFHLFSKREIKLTGPLWVGGVEQPRDVCPRQARLMSAIELTKADRVSAKEGLSQQACLSLPFTLP